MSEYIKREEVAKLLEIISRCFVGGRLMLEGMMMQLNAIPTAPVEPVVRGEWISKPPYDDWMVCSICGKDPLCNGKEEDVLSDFCPHCGAHMERSGE